MYRPTESLLRRVSQQLYNLEKRDWELWTIVSVTGILVSLGILAIALPSAFLKNGSVYFDMTVSRPLAVGLVVLVALLNTYLVGRRREVRRLREEIIFNTLQKQVIEQQSFTDPLTEIYNRRSLDDIVGRFISHARRRKVPLTFLMVDVDKVKNVNTRFGHLSGDFVLAEVANLLKGSIRGCAAAGRYGGDEFLILLADTTAAGACSVAERIVNHLAQWNAQRHLEDFMLSSSIGMAEWHDGQTLDEVLDVADRRMYQNKETSEVCA
ncbi:MAG: GGDEF domain-containing protein [Acidobacteriia bacterium]|nr:GGDEF domain-containing protein [Terriglobia bacterium]